MGINTQGEREKLMFWRKKKSGYVFFFLFFKIELALWYAFAVAKCFEIGFT